MPSSLFKLCFTYRRISWKICLVLIWNESANLMTVRVTYLCFYSLGRSSRSSTFACLLSRLTSRPKHMACSAPGPQLTCSSSTEKSRHTFCIEILCLFGAVALSLKHHLPLDCSDWAETDILLGFYSCPPICSCAGMLHNVLMWCSAPTKVRAICLWLLIVPCDAHVLFFEIVNTLCWTVYFHCACV